jgi:hypothetical protein
MSKKLILTESQVQMIMEYTMRNELRNPDDPMAYMDDMESDMSEPIVVSKPFEIVDAEDNQYLLKNPETGDVLYAIGDGFAGDIYHAMQDYLSYPQEPEENEDGKEMVPADGWEDSISGEDLAMGVQSYTNDQFNKGLLKVTNDPQEFQTNAGGYEYLLITPEILNYPEINDVILSPDLLSKAQSLFGDNM